MCFLIYVFQVKLEWSNWNAVRKKQIRHPNFSSDSDGLLDHLPCNKAIIGSYFVFPVQPPQIIYYKYQLFFFQSWDGPCRKARTWCSGLAAGHGFPIPLVSRFFFYSSSIHLSISLNYLTYVYQCFPECVPGRNFSLFLEKHNTL